MEEDPKHDVVADVRRLSLAHEAPRHPSATFALVLVVPHPVKALQQLAHEIFLKLLKAKREVPGAAERQKTLAAQDGKCALCGCGLTGTCELDHVVPVRQAFAGSVQTLQALCGDCHSEKTLRESAQRAWRRSAPNNGGGTVVICASLPLEGPTPCFH